MFRFLVLVFPLVIALSVQAYQFTKEAPQERRWQHWGNKIGEFEATFVKIENGNTAVLVDPQNKKLHVPLFYFSAPDLSYILNQLAQFPKELSEPKVEKKGNLLIDLEADNLPNGPLAQWSNQGILKGAFHSMNTDPIVTEVAGRKGVKFDYNTFFIDPKYNAMTADFLAPASVADGQSYTVASWVYFPKNSAAGSLFSWQAKDGDYGTCLSTDTAEQFIPGIGPFSFDSNDKEGIWQHLAYVYDGKGQDAQLKLYIDGIEVASKSYDYISKRTVPSDITSTSVTLHAELFLKDADEARVVAYIGSYDHHLWFQARHWKWDNQIDIGICKAGKVSVNFTDLKPNTKYYYRFLTVDKDCNDYWSYDYRGRRWDNGPGTFMTGREGQAGQVLEDDQKRQMFLGVNWGSRWYMAYSGPSSWFQGLINQFKMFDYPMDELAIRNLIGKKAAFDPKPINNALIEPLSTNLSWHTGISATKKFNLYLSTKQAELDQNAPKCLLASSDDTFFNNLELLPGAKYYWRVDQLDQQGKEIVKGDLWTFKVTTGEARNPYPATNQVVNPVGEFNWQPGRYDLVEQYVYIADSLEALAEQKEPNVVLKSKVNFGVVSPADSWRFDKLEHGKTYYWRVASLHNDGRITPGLIWQFNTKEYYVPEFDGRVAEPYPFDQQLGRTGAKIMAGNGHPTITSPAADEDLVRIITQSVDHYLKKDFGLIRMFASLPAGTIANSEEGAGWARGYHLGCYGNTGGANSDSFLLLHEMGHQIFMNGLMHQYPDFYQSAKNVFDDHAINNAWLGDYAANNIHEMMAVSCQQFLSALGHEQMSKNDNPMFQLLKKHLSGQCYIDLDVRTGLVIDNQTSHWQNNAGLQEWAAGGWYYIPKTVGAFECSDALSLTTIDGVSALKVTATNLLKWNQTFDYGIEGNRAFSCETWLWLDPENLAENKIATWGNFAINCVNIPKGQWVHFVQIFDGGVDANPAAYKTFINGKLIKSEDKTLNVSKNSSLQVGGFDGAINNFKFYAYNLSDEQVENLYKEQASSYKLPPLNVAGELLVNIDSRVLKAPATEEVFPLYPKTLNKPWLRSWVNLGTLAGQLNNDLINGSFKASGSTPLWQSQAGLWGPIFQAKDHFVSSFQIDAKTALKTIEVWLYNANNNEKTILQWGELLLTTKDLNPGWQHLAITLEAPNQGQLYINGQAAATITTPCQPSKRLHVGGQFDYQRWCWRNLFSGKILAIRAHSELLTATELEQNAKTFYYAQAHDPQPANQAIVVASRNPSLKWANSVLDGEAASQIFLGTQRDKFLKKMGSFKSGEFQPKLKANTKYYWRVGATGEIWSFTTRNGALVALSAQDLAAGELTQWPNTGVLKKQFVPGQRRNLSINTVKFNGQMGINFYAGQEMTATFPTPKCLASSFTILLEAVAPERLNTGQVFAWGKDDKKVVFRMGVMSRDKDLALKFGQGDQAQIISWPGLNSTMALIWKKIAITYDGKLAKLYLDSRLIGSTAMDLSNLDLGQLTLGAKDNANSRTLINSFKIYDKVLTAKQIKNFDGPNAIVNCQLNKNDSPAALTSIKNTGTAQGEFIIGKDINHSPTVAEVAGRKAVVFDGQAQYLESTFKTPSLIADDNPFTVEMEIYAPDNGKGFALALAPLVAMEREPGKHVRRDLGLSFSARPDRQLACLRQGNNRLWWQNPQDISRAWHHVAWVYEGGRNSSIKLYLDGKLNNENAYISLNTIPGYPMCIGGTYQRELGEKQLFKGAISQIKIYDYPQNEAEIALAAQNTKVK